jgi:ribulose-phosphate 3-epimerase
MKLAPSLLSADFGNLRAQALAVEPLAWGFHWDVMDGHFVPNLTFGPPVVNALRAHLHRPFGIHLMVDHPAFYAPRFHVYPDDVVIFHVESDDDPQASIEAIRATGARVGISLRPGTPMDRLIPFLDAVSLVLVMSVEPGFGGQAFQPGALDRVRRLSKRIQGMGIEIAVDGGIHPGNVADVLRAGAGIIVAGSAIFGAPDALAAMRAFNEAAQ